MALYKFAKLFLSVVSGIEFGIGLINQGADRTQKCPTIIAGGLLGPTNMARDEKTGDVLITEINGGRIIRVQIP